MQNIIEELLVPETNKGLFYGGAFHAASQPGETGSPLTVPAG